MASGASAAVAAASRTHTFAFLPPGVFGAANGLASARISAAELDAASSTMPTPLVSVGVFPPNASNAPFPVSYTHLTLPTIHPV